MTTHFADDATLERLLKLEEENKRLAAYAEVLAKAAIQLADQHDWHFGKATNGQRSTLADHVRTIARQGIEGHGGDCDGASPVGRASATESVAMGVRSADEAANNQLSPEGEGR